MKTKLYISILFCIVAANTWAQTYRNTYTPSEPREYEVIQSQQIMQVNAHEGTIYEPFSNVTPSEYNSENGSYSAAKAPGGPRKGFGKPDDPGEQSNEHPLGDAALPLLLMSLVFAGVIYFRKRRAQA